MNNSEHLEDELDLFEILSALWNQRVIILATTFLAFLLTAGYLKGTAKYHSKIIVTATSKTDFFANETSRSDLFLDWGTEIIWLERVDMEIQNTKLLYDAVKLALESDNTALDGISSVKKTKELSTDQLFHEDLLGRIESSYKDRELTISLETDFPESGYTLLSIILELALDKAYKNLETDILYQMVRTNRRLAHNIYFLGAFTETRLMDLASYDAKNIAFFTEELEDLNRAIEEMAEKRMFRDEPVINAMAKELTESLSPVGSSSKITKFDKAKTISSVTFFGFVAGIIIALLLDGFKQRKKSV